MIVQHCASRLKKFTVKLYQTGAWESTAVRAKNSNAARVPWYAGNWAPILTSIGANARRPARGVHDRTRSDMHGNSEEAVSKRLRSNPIIHEGQTCEWQELGEPVWPLLLANCGYVG
jgi:hypothetical protein